jgi:hypothetical protein
MLGYHNALRYLAPEEHQPQAGPLINGSNSRCAVLATSGWAQRCAGRKPAHLLGGQASRPISG